MIKNINVDLHLNSVADDQTLSGGEQILFKDPSDNNKIKGVNANNLIGTSELDFLREISEGFNTGRGSRFRAENPNNYGDIGDGAIDLSFSESASTVRGATGNNSLAIGSLLEASGFDSISIGRINIADSSGSLSLGTGCNSTSGQAIAIGRSVNTSGLSAIGIGTGISSTATSAIAIGDGADATAVASIAIGLNNTSSFSQCIAIGSNSEASQLNAIAIGAGADATSNNAFALGVDTIANSSNATAIGVNAEARNIGSVAIGPAARTDHQRSISLGFESETFSDDEINIGSFPKEYTPSNDDTDRAFNVSNGTSSLTADRFDVFTVLKNQKTGIGFQNFETTTSDALLQVNGLAKLQPIAFASLPSTPEAGEIAVINDASAISYRATAAGGGTETALVIFDGTNFIYH